MQSVRGLRPSIPVVLLAFAVVAPARAATLPAGFTETPVAGGLSVPTAMQFAPDGRLFVCEQGGRLRVIKNGTLLSTPFTTLTVNADGERGLLGVAFDPNFATTQFVYVYYTATSPTVHNRISRFTANGDVAAAGSEVALFDLPTLGATNHNGGALAFGPDGKLYAAVGENAMPSNSQSLGTVLGKMLRLNRDGSIPSDNPFVSTPGANPAIWARGLRNPFTFAFNPLGSELFINDVGQNTWEEIDDGIAGANYGWPTTEGYTTNPNFVSPRYAYNHSEGCAITGGAFYRPLTDQFPSPYVGDYFFADFCGGWIRVLDPAAGNAVTTFASGITFPVDLKVADDGTLYYLARGSGGATGVVSQIRWSAGVVTADSVTPASGSGSAQTFAVRFSDTTGATDLVQAWVWFSASFTTAVANSCLTYYDRASNRLLLLDDGGTVWLSATVGVSGALQNTQCAIAMGGSTSVTSGGPTLTLTLAMTFKPAFAGAKTLFAYGASAATNSGWQTLGTWTAGAPAVITADSVTPASGSGSTQTFAVQFSDSAGANDLAQAWVWFSASFTTPVANSCLTYYDRAGNRLLLLDDGGTAWLSATVGAAGTLQNAQCAIAMGGSTNVTPGGLTLTLNLAMTFKPAYAGAKSIFAYGANASANSGWQTLGTWTAGAPAVITADSVTPSSGSGSTQTFAVQFSDSAGAADMTMAWVWFNAAFTTPAVNSCLLFYDRPANVLWLLNDPGTQWNGVALSSSDALENGQCSVGLGGNTTATANGTTLTLNIALTFKPAYAGAKSVFLYGAAMNANSGWQTRGTWTVP